jgi:hypothetical protein
MSVKKPKASILLAMDSDLVSESAPALVLESASASASYVDCHYRRYSRVVLALALALDL